MAAVLALGSLYDSFVKCLCGANANIHPFNIDCNSGYGHPAAFCYGNPTCSYPAALCYGNATHSNRDSTADFHCNPRALANPICRRII